MYAVFQSGSKEYGKQGEPCTDADMKRIMQSLKEGEKPGPQNEYYVAPEEGDESKKAWINVPKRRAKGKRQKLARRKNRK